MFEQFRQPPPPLTRRQQQLFLATSILVAITRFLSRTRSAWDWDEALFQLGVREYDVAHHQPHPPGYPLYIALAKFVRLFVHTDFHALQIVVLIGALFFFPAAFYFARELRFDFRTSLLGALIASFLPNIWYYGGTAFSDVPGITTGLVTMALILRGARDPRAYVLGAFLLGLSAGIRPQNVMTAAVPALIATAILIRVSWKTVVIGAVAGAAAVAGCYAGAALASESVPAYIEIMHIQSKYVHDVDSIAAPNREPLANVAKRTFLQPVGAPRLFTAFEVLMLISLIDCAWRRRWAPLLALLTFLPFMFMVLLELSYEAIPRYSIGYLVAYALLAADGIAAIARLLPSRVEAPVQVVLSCALTAAFAIWTWPAVSIMRKTLSPPANAINWIRKHAKPGQCTIFVHAGLGPHATHDLIDYEPIAFERDDELPDSGFKTPAYILTPAIDASDGGEIFSLPHKRLWDIVRRRNFEAQVVPAYQLVRFGDGWYGIEGEGLTTWHWMGREARLVLPPIQGRGRFAIHFAIPQDIEPKPPTLEVRINGALIEQSVIAKEENWRSWIVQSNPSTKNEVRISISEAPVPAQLQAGADPRALGLQLRDFSWVPQQ
ncbi:MAG TPA: hypothetical protein VJ901_07155 [Thermoanaerobaculia bacterium]|nr:hypothetical protein [Thermoanaerobaculia bacterium]